MRRNGRSRTVVAELEGTRTRVAGLVGASPCEGDTGAIGPAVGRGVCAALDPGGRIGTGPAHGDRVVVPAVRIRHPGRAGGDGGCRSVELERERGRCSVSRLVGAAPAQRGARAVRAGVCQRRASGGSRGRVVATPGDRDGLVVPTVVIGPSSRDGLDLGWRRRIELDCLGERKRRGGIAGLIAARPAWGDAPSVGAVVGQRGAARDSRGGVTAAPVDRDLVVVPTVRIGRATGGRRIGDRRGGVVLERKSGRCSVSRLVGATSARRSAGAFGGAVSQRRATADSGRGVTAGPADRYGLVVPTVVIGGPRSASLNGCGRGRVVLDRVGQGE